MKKSDLSKLPPFTAALLKEAAKERADFDTPGHHSGSFFRLTAEGHLFVQELGEKAFKADISDSSSAVGDPSSHEGVSGEAEKLAASVWGSDQCFFVLGGTSSSNRIAANALLSKGDLVLFDRNNHKSTWQGALIQAGARPVYLPSSRNDSAVIGGISSYALERDVLMKEALALDPSAAERPHPFRLACLELSTYDGLFINVRKILEKIGPLCDYILFDGAWAGYENFIPILKDSAVLTFPLSEEDPGILVTQSVHKQLAGFSMTSQIHKKDDHIKDKPSYVPFDVFNDTFLMHISTSPYYPLFAGLEMNALIHQKKGKELWKKAFALAAEFKKKLLKESSLFIPFLPPEVHGKKWEEGNTEAIMEDASYFSLSTKDSWHGFSDMEDNMYLLDPCKILLTTGTFSSGRKDSIPAHLLSAFLETRNITPEKSDFYTILFLTEPGDKEKKYDFLLSVLKDFENAYRNNVPMKDFMPDVQSHPGEGLKDYCRRYHDFMVSHHAGELQASLFQKEDFPKSMVTGYEAHQAFIKGKRESVPLKKALGRVALENALPYPPGICAIAAGEIWTENILSYFSFLEEYEKNYPEFSPEILGVHHDERGLPYVWVLSV